MERSVFFLLYAVLFILSSQVDAQKTVVIMGSSTAAGSNASTYDSAWAGRLQNYFNQNPNHGMDTIFYNIANYGYDTYLEMPSDFTPPPDRPLPDPNSNVTMALSFNPNIVIINLPSNDVAFGYTKTESMNNFRLMFSRIRAAGAKCFITTSQPRNDITSDQRQALRDLVDSITNAFGAYSIDFWDDLVTTDGTNMLRPEVKDPGSDYHLNDYGHYLVFARVRDKMIFSVTDPAVDSIIDSTTLSQRSLIASKVKKLSEISPFKVPAGGLSVNKIYLSADGSQLNVELNIPQDQQVCASVLNAGGGLIFRQFCRVSAPSSRIMVPVLALPKGFYLLRISTSNGASAINPFLK